MNQLTATVPLASDFESFSRDPLRFLDHGRERYGNLFAIRDRGPVFSRVADCTGVVAIFGVEYQRAVLTDLDSFAMPVSAARHLKLPGKLLNLNRGLHSMESAQHTEHRRLVATVLSEGLVESEIDSALEEFAGRWSVGQTIRLLDHMRDLTLLISCRLLFGRRHAEMSVLTRLMDVYFQLRRDATSPASEPGAVPRHQLIEAGNSLDELLRLHVRQCREGDPTSDGLLTRLARLELAPHVQLSEDEVVGHSNVLFISSTEPIAVSLTWILLMLSQLPRLRDELRSELHARSGSLRLQLLDGVINESLRLLPPNAFMVRVTTRPTPLGGIELPARCEVVVCPFLSHRDPGCFPRPKVFLPRRWSEAPPSRFAYLPFGAGGHSCIGQRLAMSLLKTTLAFLLPRYDLVLDGDQEVDWRLHILFMPRKDPAVVVRSPTQSLRPGGILGGPVARMIDLEAPDP